MSMVRAATAGDIGVVFRAKTIASKSTLSSIFLACAEEVMIRPCLELSFDQHTAVANAASKRTAIASRQLVHCTESGTPSGNGEPSLLASCHSPSTAEKRQFSLRGHAAGYFSHNKMLWPGSIKPASSVRTPATANSKQLNSSSSSRPSTCLHDAAHTMGSISTYIVLATASLSVTYLAFLLYSAYGFAAFKAAAPFIGTVTLVFAAAHCLDLANESKDAEARDAKGLTAAAAAAAPVSTAGARGARGAAPMPKRRRVAD